MKNIFKSIVAVLLMVMSQHACAQFKMVGYMPSWSGSAAEIQYSKLTHINYAFIRPTTTGGLTAIDQPAKLQDIVSRAHAAGVKVGIAVGGWSDLNNADFQSMASNSTYRNNFINNIINLINQYQLDGVDLDWEYPIDGNDPANFATLMTELGNAMHTRGKFLTAAVAGGAYYGNGVLSGVFSAVDFLNIMAYDGDAGAGHSPYSFAVSAVDYWVGRGLPASKAVLGVPFYARPSWKSFRTLLAEGASPNSDTYNGDYYNGIPTIKAKTNFAFDRGLGGIMFWELSQDAIGQYSLVTAIKEVKDQRSGGGTAPAAPSSLTASAISSSQINLSWTDNSSNESLFRIERSLNGTTWSSLTTTGANVRTYSNTGLSASTTYYYRVRAENSYGNSGYTNTANATTQSVGGGLPAPWATQDVGSPALAGTASHSSGTFTAEGAGADIWGASDQFRFISQTLSGDGQIVARVASIENTNAWAKAGVMIRSSLAANSPHAMIVVTPSNGVSFQRRLTAGATSASTAGSMSTAPRYVRMARSGSTFTASESADGVTWTTVGSATITMGTTTYVGLVVTSHNTAALATAQYTNVSVSTSTGTVPAAPSGLSAASASSSQINLSWTDNSANESLFRIERSADGSTWASIATTGANATTYSNTGLAASTTYYYRVRAENGTGNSGYSNTANATTQPPTGTAPAAPSGLSASAASSTQINLSWSDNSSNESLFRIERSANGSTGWASIATTGANATTYSNTGLTASTTYYYRVRAENSIGNSAYSNTANATTQAGSGGGCTGVAQYVENGGYVEGSLVQNVGSKYQCKPYPFTGWCNGAAWAYAPGTGQYWQDAWTLLGSCSSSALRSATGYVTAEPTSFDPESKGLYMYPNPGKSENRNLTLVFETDPGTVAVGMRNINGIEVFGHYYKDQKSGSLTVELPDLPQGLYMIRVQGEKKSWVRKYLIK